MGAVAKRDPGLERLDAAEFERRFLREAPLEGAAEASWTLVLFDRGRPEDRRLGRVLARAAEDHGDRVRVAAVSAQDVLERLRHWQDGRRAVDSFSFTRWPVAGLFRHGHIITTFNPRLVFFPEHLQQEEEHSQLEVFLEKMVYYDPAAVKAQKNIEVEAGA